jgi:hypothetical protein
LAGLLRNGVERADQTGRLPAKAAEPVSLPGEIKARSVFSGVGLRKNR